MQTKNLRWKHRRAFSKADCNINFCAFQDDVFSENFYSFCVCFLAGFMLQYEFYFYAIFLLTLLVNLKITFFPVFDFPSTSMPSVTVFLFMSHLIPSLLTHLFTYRLEKHLVFLLAHENARHQNVVDIRNERKSKVWENIYTNIEIKKTEIKFRVYGMCWDISECINVTYMMSVLDIKISISYLMNSLGSSSWSIFETLFSCAGRGNYVCGGEF